MINGPPESTVPEVLQTMRDEQGANVTLALLDFRELTPDEKDEFVLRALLEIQKGSVEIRMVINQILDRMI